MFLHPSISIYSIRKRKLAHKNVRKLALKNVSQSDEGNWFNKHHVSCRVCQIVPQFLGQTIDAKMHLFYWTKTTTVFGLCRNKSFCILLLTFVSRGKGDLTSESFSRWFQLSVLKDVPNTILSVFSLGGWSKG